MIAAIDCMQFIFKSVFSVFFVKFENNLIVTNNKPILNHEQSIDSLGNQELS